LTSNSPYWGHLRDMSAASCSHSDHEDPVHKTSEMRCQRAGFPSADGDDRGCASGPFPNDTSTYFSMVSHFELFSVVYVLDPMEEHA